MGHPTAIFLSPPDPNFRCGICLDVFEDPVSLLHCGHTFCRSCLDSTLAQTGRRCPECRAEIDVGEEEEDDDDDDENPLLLTAGGNGNVIHPVRVIRSAIDNSLVRCGNGLPDEDGDGGGRCGCDWTGPLSSWHLHSSTACPVAEVRCPVPGCGRVCPRASMRAHAGSAECVEAAVATRVEERMEGLLADLGRRMRREVRRRVRGLREERGEIESRLALESGRRLELQDENEELQREVCGLRRELGEMKRTARGGEGGRHRWPREGTTREEGGGGGSEDRVTSWRRDGPRQWTRRRRTRRRRRMRRGGHRTIGRGVGGTPPLSLSPARAACPRRVRRTTAKRRRHPPPPPR